MKSAAPSRGIALAAILAAGTSLATIAPAHADDYTDLLEVLRARGSLSDGEYSTLARKHSAGLRTPTGKRAAAAQRRRDRLEQPGTDTADTATMTAREAAASAAASAAQAQAAMQTTQAAMASPEIVRASPYTPGKGLGFNVGSIAVNISGFVNGYYTYSSADKGANTLVAGGLTDRSGFDSSSVRSGLLPSALILKASTTQAGIDLAVVFGIYPGINSANVGALNANNGGSPYGLGTSGIDFRQIYFTAGTKEFGTFKVGRDIGIFGSDAILSDATLLGVGATGGNANPANTSLGRIGIGYIYTDFLPQITYTSPVFYGFQATVGAVTPLDELNFSGLSGTSVAHDTPMFQGKLTYDYKSGDFATRVWVGGLIQPQEGITGPAATPGGYQTASAGEAGAKFDYGRFGAVGYYYAATGVGSTGLFFDGIDALGNRRDSEGWYVQATVKPIAKLKLVASYGQSSLNQAPGEFSPLLVRRNEAIIGGGYYSLTDWLTLVGEYAHTNSTSHGENKSSADSVSLGGIIFF